MNPMASVMTTAAVARDVLKEAASSMKTHSKLHPFVTGNVSRD
jgi:hypothetical protein